MNKKTSQEKKELLTAKMQGEEADKNENNFVQVAANQEKSVAGHDFEKEIVAKLTGSEIEFYAQPKYAYPGYSEKQFSPDFMVLCGEKNSITKVIVADATTSVRHDRLKGKQWDADNAKKAIADIYKDAQVYYIVVVPNQLAEKEQKHVDHEKKKILSREQKKYYSAIDDMMPLDEFVNFIIQAGAHKKTQKNAEIKVEKFKPNTKTSKE